MPRPYDEDSVLTDYVWNHYQDLMTVAERAAGRAAAFNEKADGYDPSSVSTRLRSMVAALKSDPVVAPLLELPPSQFRRAVRDRLMAEHADSINLNRCPRCARIPRSPRAQQCPWCHHSWGSS
jgi:hypothetical protein